MRTYRGTFYFIIQMLLCGTGMFTAQNSLQLVQILFRHGDRTPIEPFPTDKHKDYWTQGFGQLTKIGKQEQYELGQFIRKRYQDFLNESYNCDEVLINSTNVDRTLMSAESVLAGLYPPSSEELWNDNILWQPVPVHTEQTPTDYVLNTDSYCPKYDSLYSKVLLSPGMQQINEENKGLYGLVTNKTGRNVMDIFGINKVHDTLLIEKLYNLSIPGWVDPVYNQMRNLSNLSFTWKYKLHEERRLKGGPLVGHMIHNMQLRIDRQNTVRKTYLFSSHDTSVSAFLSALDLFNGIAPPYAAAVFVELHSMSSDKYGVQILYRNSSSKDPYLMIIPNCSSLCPLDKFVALTESIIPDDIVSECKVTSDILKIFPWPVAVAVVCLTGVFLISLLFGIMCWRKRQGHEYHYVMVQNE